MSRHIKSHPTGVERRWVAGRTVPGGIGEVPLVDRVLERKRGMVAVELVHNPDYYRLDRDNTVAVRRTPPLTFRDP